MQENLIHIGSRVEGLKAGLINWKRTIIFQFIDVFYKGIKTAEGWTEASLHIIVLEASIKPKLFPILQDLNGEALVTSGLCVV